MATDEKELLFDALFPMKIKQFILKSEGTILKVMSQEREVRAHAIFSVQELKIVPIYLRSWTKRSEGHLLKIKGCNRHCL